MAAGAKVGVSLLVAMLTGGTAYAKELSGADITAVLSGNSISASDEVQYFNPNGSTIYKTGGKRQTGKWSVEGNKYCSNLSGGKKCYVVEGGKGSISFIVDGKPYKYNVSKGQKVK